MSSKDYKNALNDIRLSSDFCAKMEKKLAKPVFDDDGYQEIENHVEVIENKGFKKYLAAAAVIAVIGAVGGGGYMSLKGGLGSDAQYGVDSEVEDVTDETENSGGVFEFPFAPVKIKGTTFIFRNFDHNTTLSENPIIANDEMAAQLIEVFSQVDWTEKSNYTYITGNDNTEEAHELEYAISSALSGSSISFSYGFNGEYSSVTLYENGLINVNEKNTDKNSETQLTYNMTSEQFDRIKSILFGAESMATFAGIKTDLSGTRYTVNGSSGTVTDEQAASLAYLLDNMTDSLLSESHTERPDEEPVSLFITDDVYDCRVDFYSNGEIFNKKIINSNNEVIERAYKYSPMVYLDIVKILEGCKSIPCPVDITGLDGALLKYTLDNKCNVYDLSSEDLTHWQSLLESCNWKTELYSSALAAFSNFYPTIYENSLIIKNKDSMLFIHSSGHVIYLNKCGITSFTPDIYHIEDYDKLISESKAMLSQKVSLTAAEAVSKELDIALSADKTTLAVAGNDYGYVSGNEGRVVPTDRIREAFEGLDWEEEFFEGDLSDDPEAYIEYVESLPSDIRFYVINPNTAYSSFSVNSQGFYTAQETGLTYRCTEPEKLTERLDALYEEFKK